MTKQSISRCRTFEVLNFFCLGMAGGAFIPASQGCSMSHCDVKMSDQSNMMSLEGDVQILWTDQDPIGAPYMVGCSSNGRHVVCSFGPIGSKPFLKAYNGDGDILWSYNGLGPLASHSAPMIDDAGTTYLYGRFMSVTSFLIPIPSSFE